MSTLPGSRDDKLELKFWEIDGSSNFLSLSLTHTHTHNNEPCTLPEKTHGVRLSPRHLTLDPTSHTYEHTQTTLNAHTETHRHLLFSQYEQDYRIDSYSCVFTSSKESSVMSDTHTHLSCARENSQEAE